jgi:hypothetical protein
VDLGLPAGDSQGGIGDGDVEVLAGLVLAVPARTASNQRRNSGMVPIEATRWCNAVCSWPRTNSPVKISSPQPQPHSQPPTTQAGPTTALAGKTCFGRQQDWTGSSSLRSVT